MKPEQVDHAPKSGSYTDIRTTPCHFVEPSTRVPFLRAEPRAAGAADRSAPVAGSPPHPRASMIMLVAAHTRDTITALHDLFMVMSSTRNRQHAGLFLCRNPANAALASTTMGGAELRRPP